MYSSSPIVLVFGASRGMGASCLADLAQAGWQVAHPYVSRPAEGSAGRGHAAGFRDTATVAHVFDQLKADFGARPNAVVASAGINVPTGPTAQFKPKDFREVMEVSIVGALILEEAARRVQDGGSIVAVSTSLVRHAVPGTGPYAATRAAAESMVRAMAKELAGRGVRVNAVAPGPVDTELFNAGKTEEVKQRMAAFSPRNRIGRPAEIAQVVRFLLSDESSWVHGQVVQPNGGMV